MDAVSYSPIVSSEASSLPVAGEPDLMTSHSQSILMSLYGKVSFWPAVFTILLGLVLYDQVKYITQKGSIAGPAFKIPFIGPFLESVNPKFEEYCAKWASGPLSCVSVFHKFVVIASTRDMARKVFNSPMFVKPCVVDVAYKLLRPTNWVFLDGKQHVDYRRGLNILFTRNALEAYLPGQEEEYQKYFRMFLEISKKANYRPVQFMNHFRELMCAVSLRTFVGDYMPEEAIKKIADDYYKITAALELVNFPIILPFTRTWRGKKAADMVLVEFQKCAAMSKDRMRTGGKADSILDRWVLAMYASEDFRTGKTTEKPEVPVRLFTDYEIAQTLFTFLFASQDATSSAATWMFQLMADRPEMLARVREENFKARGGDPDGTLSLAELSNLTFTRAVVKETLRYRPPVIMVPYVAKKAFPLTDTYTAPKGSMVIPTTYPALHDPEAYPNPDTFDPDRWITGDAELQTKNWLVFGTGPHYCLGQVYAVHNLILMLGKASMQLEWDHLVTPLSEEIKVFATIFPKDDLFLTFRRRETPTTARPVLGQVDLNRPVRKTAEPKV